MWFLILLGGSGKDKGGETMTRICSVKKLFSITWIPTKAIIIITHILEHKTNLYKSKKNKTTSCILPNYNTIKLKINHKNKISSKYPNWQWLNSSLLNEEWVKKEIKFLEPNENENITKKRWGTLKKFLQRKFIALHTYIKKSKRYIKKNLFSRKEKHWKCTISSLIMQFKML